MTVRMTSKPLSFELGARPLRLSLLRVAWLVLRLRLVRWRNQAADAMSKLSNGRIQASRGHRTSTQSLASVLAAAFWVAALIAAFSYQSYRIFEQIAAEAGAAALSTRAAWLLVVLAAAVAMADTETRGTSRQRHQELDWLLSLPAPWWVLQTGRFVEATVANPAGLVFLLPFLIGLSLHGQAGVTAVVLACALWLSLAAIGTMLRWLFQAMAQLFLPRRIRSACKIVLNGAGLAVALGYLVLPSLPRDLLAAGVSLNLPPVEWLPFTGPVQVLLSLGMGWKHVAVPLGWFLVEFAGVLLLGITGLRWAYGRTFPSAGAVVEPASRTVVQSGMPVRHRLRMGVWAKDSLWLLRQPDKLASLVLGAALASGAAIVVAERLFESTLTPAALGGTAFAVGLAMLAVSSRQLEAESAALRLLATLPRSLAQIYASKSLWLALLSGSATLPVLGYGLQRLGMTLALVPPLAAAFAGIVLHAFFACSLALRTLHPDRPSSALEAVLRLCKLALAGAVFCAGFAFPSQLTLMAWLVLCTTLTITFWQDSVASAALALDRWTRPPKSLSPSHGIVAVLALRVLQVLFGDRLAEAGVEPGLVPTLSFALAAFSVLIGVVCLVRYWKIQWSAETLGWGRGASTKATAREALLWSVPGLLAALVTLLVASHWPWLEQSLEASTRLPALAPASTQLWIVLGTVLFAPIVEELLFRGLIYRTARSTMSVFGSLLLSTAVFTALHPRAAALPIFCLGACAALAYERSRSLLAAILVHVVYNTFLVAAVLLL